MQIEKIKIVIASVLKPVDDTRMFEKMGVSLADSARYEVFIIGFPASNPPIHPAINFVPLGRFKRLSLGRIFAAWKIFRMIAAIKPAVFIFCTHELLLQAVLYKLFFRKKIVYDVRENYFRNILFIPSFPVLTRPLLALYVRVKEYCLAPLIDHFILAESGYAQELHFPGNQKTILENKIREPMAIAPRTINTDGLIYLLFSGTLAESTGIFNAIKLAKTLHALEPRIRLTIIGYCALDQTLKAIRSAIQPLPFIELIGGDQLVPHDKVITAIQQSQAGIVSYPPNFSTYNSIPTKLFEYLGYALPILLVNHAPWIAYCSPYSACIPIDFDAIDARIILERLKRDAFYCKTPKDIFWSSEERKLLSLLNTLITHKHN